MVSLRDSWVINEVEEASTTAAYIRAARDAAGEIRFRPSGEGGHKKKNGCRGGRRHGDDAADEISLVTNEAENNNENNKNKNMKEYRVLYANCSNHNEIHQEYAFAVYP